MEAYTWNAKKGSSGCTRRWPSGPKIVGSNLTQPVTPTMAPKDGDQPFVCNPCLNYQISEFEIVELREVQPADSELVREFVIAGHGNLARVKEMLAEHPELLNAAYPWSETDKETAIMAAGQVGNVAVAEYLLAKGAPLSICTAAMLGRQGVVEQLLGNNPESIRDRGAHGIPLLAHAALSGNRELVQMLVERGATDGVSFALHNAVARGYQELALWILENGRPDLTWKNYQGKTALEVALERKDDAFIRMLREHGASD